jgi:mannose-1-phosphate guanylyltransferase
LSAPVTRAMLLAAGKGERLKPLTEHTPKPLVPVGGRPMVAYVLDLLAAAGIREVHVNLHHLGARVPDALGDGSAWGLSLCYHPEAEILGTGGGLSAACRDCPDLAGGDFVMINADILTDVDLGAVIATHQAAAQGGVSPLATLVLRDDPEAARFGVIGTDLGGRIRRFLEVNTGGAAREHMFTGVQVLSPEILALMPTGGVFPITDAYKAALKAGAPLMAHLHRGYWADLGTPERLGRAEADLAAGRAGRLTPAGEGR